MFNEIHSATGESFPTHIIPPSGIKGKKAELPRILRLAAQPHLTSIVNQVIPPVKKTNCIIKNPNESESLPHLKI